MSTNIRSDRLAKYLAAVLRENQEIRDLSDFKRFIDAILNTKEPCGAVERLVSNENALSALRHGLRFDITPAFINKYTSKFLNFLRKPEIKLLCNGIFLERILVIIVEPRTLWKSLLDAFFTRKLDDDATHVFCWLTTEVLSLPASSGVDITTDAQAMLSDGYLESSSSALLRNLGHKIKYLLDMRSSASTLLTTEDTVGGRHDNDFADFRLIAILPTTDELSCAEKPFYRRVEEIAQLSGVQRIAAHADNQFRLLREDMLSALREDIHVATSTKKKRRTALRLRGLSLANISCVSADLRYIRPCTIGITAKSGLEKLNTLSRAEAKGFLKNTPQYVKHRALGCFVRNTEIVAFATIERNLDDLLAVPPVVKLRAAGREAMRKTLLFLKLYDDVEFLVVDTATFAYEPILKCLQERVEFPFTEELFLYERGQPLKDSALAPQSVISELRKNDRPRLQATLKTTKQVTLDPFQRDSLLAGLTQRVSLIQGPPGTGKSFIGALLAKVLHDFTDDKILVMCYTNHALDQFLEDLLDIGIEASDIVRLGSKSTPRTEPLSLKEQKLTRKRPNSAWNTINALNDQAQDQRDNIMSSFAAYQELSANPLAILDYLEFEEPDYFEAFTVPEDEDGMSVVDKQGKTIKKGYLYERWTRGQSPDPVAESLPARSCTIWALDQKFRDEKVQAWKRALLNEQAESLAVQMDLLDDCHARLTAILGEKTREILKKKKIIGCTTTAAAMYADDLKHISPGIVLLEEAGEILESHVLTALSPDTKHLILIGDHLQLRPKINSYALSKEIGDGYDLNVSLFERLIHTGYPHITLQKQHRMCPEISDLVRSLTYPQLQDDEKTKTRPKPRGLTDRVIFINHQNPEHSFSAISDRRDEEAKQSKQNAFEAEIVLAIVKYLGQQGYGTDKLVVLTPYLGQLSLLRQTLSKQNDPVLNDLDSHDLVEAGLLSQASADYSKQPIKLSTIDNYQGEESDIVIASLTRSNRNGDVGFMAAPERLNVLLSRARNILIMVGNLETFASSRKGQTYWKPLFDRLKTNGHIYDGLPIKCEQHPGTTAILSTKEDFEREAPNGGCSAPCGAKLSCGIHECPSKCHKLADHSKKVCKKMVHRDCPRGHKLVLPCSTSQTSCRSCAHEDKIQKQKHDQDMRLEAERKRSQALYAQKLADLQSEASHLRRLNSDKSVESERARVLEQYSQEIKELRSSQCSIESTPSTQRAQETVSGLSEPRPRSLEPPAVGNLGSRSMTSRNEPRVEPRSQEGMPEQPVSKARDDWEYQKSYYNSQSPEIDTLMDMVGLEAVKSKFLTIKAKVDIAVRQDVDLSHERFGSILVGNPGTGKTTVARLYAKFLAAVGIIPGHKVIETTGSRLSNEGVPQCQKMVEQLLKDGGGVIFIDEAYQMVQGNNFGGSQVLDFLLAEVENLTGKIVFVLAGYQRPMEKFLAHNPGLPSRFPLELKFDDFDEAELLMIVRAWIERKWKRQMEVDGGLDGLYCRIVARRIARGRCQEGFANARAVENAMAKITERQTERLMKQKRQGGSPVNELFLDKEDMIGPEPSQRLKSSKAWQKLQGMIGLAEVKKTVESLIDTIQYNYRRELDELAVVGYNLNKVFLGNPGTGKTSVARIYGQILVDIGLLSNGEVVVKNPSDFIGAVMGESEKNTKGILAATLGKVLVIDEAYGLSTSGSSDGAGARSDPYRSAVIDTIVAEVQSAPGDNQCVLLLGYKDQMEQMFQAVNPGLSRRFPIDQAFIFEDFSAQELGLILDLKLSEQGYSITDQARQVALEMLERARNRPHFGNAGEIDILLNIAKLHHQGRISSNGLGSRALDSVLDAVDFDENFDRVEKGEFNMKKLFEGVVGCESIISTLEGYQNMVKRLRELHMDPREQVPFNFVFRGPPGTGKTSTARKMGQVYYNMGLLSSVEVIEASATDLVGQFVGQTGPKTQKLLERGLGKVLFIDEAYRLAEGHFAKEAMDELVDCITKPRFAKKVIIILAGYDADINRLMTINTGLTSRFPDSFQFKSLSPQDCIELLNKLLKKQKETIYSTSGVNFNISCLDDSSFDYHRRLTDGFDALSRTASWANARDVETLAKAIFGKTIKTSQSLCGAELALSRDTVTEELHDMLVERRSRGHLLTESSAVSLNHKKNLQVCIESPQPQSEESQSLKSNVKANDQAYAPVQKSSDQQGLGSGREAGVTDEDWIQLEKDKVAAKQDEKDYLRMTEEMEKQTKELLSLKEKETQAARAVEEARQQQNERLRVRFEQERVRCKMERRRQEAIARELEIKRQTLAEARRKDQATQAKLRSMGVCVQGYRWIKRPGGYKCEGGGHFVPNSQLE
ncbi:P-loop containing nucleoside triphosphate hydrolase protein [Aspergillus homomorphus CBS 101889]|uniref:P-loop containing nucleoside triphosphate hydrolase protein n=1 Tax=Aspergillus homomorphus (strain CBS 101889) TaxID=1450537 RepID=A0A395I723_ASPHC|nr:P-loop containing nucleoside triphosphate hydrolase protein [Aspergillus homomorphus CBS 101889]RAL15897.1 P-loop containing nucleoside triphosphate hydrolase protein [Aspergillus homomorphus CBS 101889]